MTKTTQHLADEMARKCALAIPPDVLEHPMPFLARLDYATKQIKQSVPLLELLEVARTAQRNQSVIMDKGEAYWDMKAKLENLQKKVEL